MSTATPTAADAAVSPPDRASRTVPIRRIIVGSLATGLVVAAVLTLVVFSGASEPFITGSGLLGFAVGCWQCCPPGRPTSLNAGRSRQPPAWPSPASDCCSSRQGTAR